MRMTKGILRIFRCLSSTLIIFYLFMCSVSLQHTNASIDVRQGSHKPMNRSSCKDPMCAHTQEWKFVKGVG